MSVFGEFLQHLFDDGDLAYRGPPPPKAGPDGSARAVLKQAFAAYRLDVAGPLIDFEAPTAEAAAELVWHAGWFLLSRQEPTAELDRRLIMPGPPRSAAQHLSADLTLHYVPQICRRAQALAPADHLVTCLTGILRRWPLSGVLSAVPDAPETPPDLDGHPGLMLLYAERLAQNERRAWVPAGRSLEYAELVYAGLGKRLPALPTPRTEEEVARDE
jgi:hypothetical protein